MNSLDFMYIAFGASALLLAVFVSVLIVFAVLILKDVNQITKNMKSSAEKIEEYIVQPTRVLQGLVEKMGVLNTIYQKVTEHFGLDGVDMDDDDGGSKKGKSRRRR